VSAAARRVVAVLRVLVNADEWLFIADVARRTRLSEKQCRLVLRALHQEGIAMERAHRVPGEGGQAPLKYRARKSWRTA
jgi:DNA-binding IclR family transcriptional regulator